MEREGAEVRQGPCFSVLNSSVERKGIGNKNLQKGTDCCYFWPSQKFPQSEQLSAE